MPLQIWISFGTFVLISGITPGPANLTSLATSIQYGKKIAIKQWFGIFTGAFLDGLISVVIVYFLGNALNDYVKWLAFIGVAYLVYLAVHILFSTYKPEQTKLKEPNFWTGLILNLTNIKVLLTCITSLSSYVLPNTLNFWILLGCGIYLGVVQPGCNLVWLFSGVALQKFFQKHTRIINIVLAIALLACAVSLALVPFGIG